MTETGKFLQRRAALAALVAIPIAAVGAVLLDGAGEAARELTQNETDSGAPAALPYDNIQEDDGDL